MAPSNKCIVCGTETLIAEREDGTILLLDRSLEVFQVHAMDFGRYFLAREASSVPVPTGVSWLAEHKCEVREK